MTDSAGVPWQGRTFHENPGAGDDGSAPPRLVEAIRRFGAGELGAADVVEVLHESRLLLPLMAERGDEGIGPHGAMVDKTQELSLIATAGPDGRPVLLAFSGVEAMRAWNPEARPIPIAAARVALAAAAEGTPLIVLDPRTPTMFVVRRPALRAVATGERWLPSFEDPEVLQAFLQAGRAESHLAAIQLAPGDPTGRLQGPELLVQLSVRDGLDADGLAELVARLGERWSADPVIAERADSLSVVVERV